MQQKHFFFKYLYIVCLLSSSLSLHAALLDDFIENIHHKPNKKHHKKYRSHHSLSDAAKWQTSLQFLGYYKGKIDGDLYTQASFDAVTAFHIKHEEVTTGFLEEEDKKYLSEIYQVIALNQYIVYEGKNKKKNYQKLQAALKWESFYKGKIDGSFGKKSKQAFLRYKMQFDNNVTDINIKENLISHSRENIEKRLDKIKEDRFNPEKYKDDTEKTELFSL